MMVGGWRLVVGGCWLVIECLVLGVGCWVLGLRFFVKFELLDIVGFQIVCESDVLCIVC